MSAIRGDANARYLPYKSVTDMGGSPAMGFFPALAAAFEATTAATNIYSLEYSLQRAEEENIAKLAQIGIEMPTLDTIGNNPMDGDWALRDISTSAGYGPYTDFQRAAYDANTFQSRDDDESKRQAGLRQRAIDMTKARDETIRKARAENPDLGLETYEEMRQRVVNEGTKRYSEYYNSRGSLFTNIGGMIGEMAGSLDPTTNPLWSTNFLGGGFGRTAAMRILSQFGFGAGSEFMGQLGGQLETMRWFGIEPTGAQRAVSIAAAGVLPAGVQALGEGFGRLAARSIARRNPQPPAPAPAPAPAAPVAPPPVMRPGLPNASTAVRYQMANTLPAREIMDGLGLPAFTRPRFAHDVDHVARQADMWGISPADTTPPMARMREGASVIPTNKAWLGPGGDDIGVTLPASWNRAARGHDVTTSEVARGEWGAGRATDPEVFDRIDKLAKQITDTKSALQRAINLAKERTVEGRFGKPETERLLQGQIEAGTRVRSTAGTARVAKQTEALRAMQEGRAPVPAAYDPEKLAAKLADLQAKQMELFPVAERAIARAQGEWELIGSQRDAFLGTALKKTGVGIYRNKDKTKMWLGPERDPPGAPDWVTKAKKGLTSKKLAGLRSPVDPEIPELLHPAAREGGALNEPQIDAVQRAHNAMASEVDGAMEAAAKMMAKLIDDADNVAKMEAKAGEAQPVPTLPDGTPISQVRNMMITVGDETISVGDFITQLKHESEAVADIMACQVSMGWATSGS